MHAKKIITVWTVLIVATALITTGCLTPQNYTPVMQFTIAPDFTDLPTARSSMATLGIRRLSASQPLKRDIFYRDPDLRVGNLLDAQWAENPADMMTRHVFDAAVASGRFHDVGLATDIPLPTFVLTGDVRRFDLDRTKVPWQAVCEIHFELRTVSNGNAAWSDTLTSSIPLAQDEVPALAEAMSQAAAQVIHEAMGKIVKAEPNN